MLAHKAALTELVYALLQGMVVAFQCGALGRRELPLSSHARSRLTSRVATPSGWERGASADVWGSGGVRARVCDEFRSEERHECGEVRVGHCLDGRDGDMRAGALVKRWALVVWEYSNESRKPQHRVQEPW